VLGAVMIGWMVLLWSVVRGPFAKGERWASNAVTASVATWFVLDCTFSVATGY
jgi:hypothetical protein